MPVDYLVYVSQAASGLDTQAIEAILDESRAYNPAHDITGVLLFVGAGGSRPGSFMQLLEGDMAELESLRRRIFADPRHHTKVVLEKGRKPARDFADWSMAYKAAEPAQLRDHPVFADLSDPDFIRRCEIEGAEGALRFLCEFWEQGAD